MAGSVTKVTPPITPASPASAQPAPNTSMNTRGTLWPSASAMSGWVSAAWITRPTRVWRSSSHSASSINRATQHHERPRGREGGARRVRAGGRVGVAQARGTGPLATDCTSVKAGRASTARWIERHRRAAPQRPARPRGSAWLSPNVSSSSATLPEPMHAAQARALEPGAQRRPPPAAPPRSPARSPPCRVAWRSPRRHPACRSPRARSSARPSC